jgi:hypothetical protein
MRPRCTCPNWHPDFPDLPSSSFGGDRTGSSGSYTGSYIPPSPVLAAVPLTPMIRAKLAQLRAQFQDRNINFRGGNFNNDNFVPRSGESDLSTWRDPETIAASNEKLRALDLDRLKSLSYKNEYVNEVGDTHTGLYPANASGELDENAMAIWKAKGEGAQQYIKELNDGVVAEIHIRPSGEVDVNPGAAWEPEAGGGGGGFIDPAVSGGEFGGSFGEGGGRRGQKALRIG